MNLKVGIICASDSEVAPFLPCIKDCVVTEKAMLKIYEGTINSVPIVTLFCGVCKVNAAIASQILIDCYGVTVIINAGVAGGMKENLEIFDTVISTEAAYHDMSDDILTEFHPWMESVYFAADPQLTMLSKKAAEKLRNAYRIFWGRMVTGESFIKEDGRTEINDRFAPLSVDMETASIAHVCYVNQIPFLAIRTLTDTATHSGMENFDENCLRASMIAKEITLLLLDEFLSIPSENMGARV